jgi:hypothetical protein
MAKRGYGTGHLYEKHGSYYGRWRTLNGRLVNRLIGPIRPPGARTGLTRVQAERILRQLQDQEEKTPRRRTDVSLPTLDEVADSLRQELRLIAGGRISRAASRCSAFTSPAARRPLG